MTQPDRGIEELKSGLTGFFERRRIESPPFGRYSFMPGKTETYWSSGYAALCLSLAGLLDGIGAESKKQWIEYLQNGQNEETGLFNEPVNEENAPKGPVHHAKDVFWHGATFAFGALHVLGGEPLHPVNCISQYKRPGTMERWIRGLPWNDPWKAGNWTYDMGCLMGTDYLTTGDKRNLAAMDEFFEWHDKNTDGESGWWNPSGASGQHKEVFGGYHTLMVYWMYGRDVPDPEKMIMSALSLQCENGSYMNMGCCGDMDVIDTAVTLSRQYGVCEKEVRASVEKFHPYLMSLVDPEGGFIGQKGDTHIDLGWKLHEGERGKADPCSTYFRTFTLSLVDEMLEIIPRGNIEWKHMDGFCHGRRPDCLL